MGESSSTHQTGPMESGRRVPRVTLVELVLALTGALLAAGSGHFLAQLLAGVLVVLFIVWCIRRRIRTALNWILLGGFVLFVALLCLPFDFALRDGPHWSIGIVEVGHFHGVSSDRLFRDGADLPASVPAGRPMIAYPTSSIFVDVRWALLVTVPVERQLYTPLFIRPR